MCMLKHVDPNGLDTCASGIMAGWHGHSWVAAVATDPACAADDHARRTSTRGRREGSGRRPPSGPARQRRRGWPRGSSERQTDMGRRCARVLVWARTLGQWATKEGRARKSCLPRNALLCKSIFLTPPVRLGSALRSRPPASVGSLCSWRSFNLFRFICRAGGLVTPPRKITPICLIISRPLFGGFPELLATPRGMVSGPGPGTPRIWNYVHCTSKKFIKKKMSTNN